MKRPQSLPLGKRRSVALDAFHGVDQVIRHLDTVKGIREALPAQDIPTHHLDVARQIRPRAGTLRPGRRHDPAALGQRRGGASGVACQRPQLVPRRQQLRCQHRPREAAHTRDQEAHPSSRTEWASA
jgi:hypothetical protein